MQVLLAQVLLGLPAERGVSMPQHDSRPRQNDLLRSLFVEHALAINRSLPKHPDEGYVDLAGSTVKIMAALREEQAFGSLPITGLRGIDRASVLFYTFRMNCVCPCC